MRRPVTVAAFFALGWLVTGTAVALTCTDDSTSGSRDVDVTLDVLANDAGYDASTVTVNIVAAPTQGTAVTNPDHTITFSPPAGLGGLFIIRYQVIDGSSSSSVCTATIQIEAEPEAVDDNLAASVDSTTSLNVLANDVGVTDTPLTLTIITVPLHGTAIVDDSGAIPEIRYTPDSGYADIDSLQYQVADADGDVSNVASVAIDLNPGETPVANDDSGDVNFGQRTPLDLLGNDTGLGDVPITIEITRQPAHGVATAETDPFPFIYYTYTDSAGYPRADTLRYRLRDADGALSNEATLTVTPFNILNAENDPDRIQAVSPSPGFPTGLGYPTAVDDPITIDVLANDGGLLNTPIQVSIEGELNGTAVVNADNTVTFTPTPGFTGINYIDRNGTITTSDDTLVVNAGFVYRLTDSTGAFEEARVLVDVFADDVTDDGGSSFDVTLLALLISGVSIRIGRRGGR